MDFGMDGLGLRELEGGSIFGWAWPSRVSRVEGMEKTVMRMRSCVWLVDRQAGIYIQIGSNPIGAARMVVVVILFSLGRQADK